MASNHKLSGSKFQGMSLLRAEEKAKQAKPATNSALQDYLKKYIEGDSSGSTQQATKKRKKKAAAHQPAAVRIIDQDLTGFATLRQQAHEDGGAVEDDTDDDAPTIANAEEGAALAKQVEKSKHFFVREEDGSGWVQASSGTGLSRLQQSSPGASVPPQRPHHHPLDASPPRRRPRHNSPDVSLPQLRHDLQPDTSPPRRGQRHDSLPTASPRRGQRHDSPPDASPLRRGQRHDSPPDASPPRRGQRHDSPPDASPLRRGQRHDSPPDASPPRRGQAAAGARAATDLPPSGRHSAIAVDLSPPRCRSASAHVPSASWPAQRHDSPDVSPPRRPAIAGGSSATAGRVRAAEAAQRMADGTVTGLVSARQLMEEVQQQRKDAEARREAAGGRGEATVYRDRITGKAVTAAEYAESVRLAKGGKKAKTAEEEAEEQHLEWRGGLAQKRAAEQRVAEMRAEAAKPFARGEEDAERDALFRERARFGDPMAHLVKSKAPAADLPTLTDRYDAAALQKSGFLIPQETPAYSWLRRGVAAPANRYNIRPGRHWDGVDRSNGFEKDYFKQLNAKRANEYEARLWSQADM